MDTQKDEAEAGADIKAQSSVKTASQHAERRPDSHPEVVKLLLDATRNSSAE